MASVYLSPSTQQGNLTATGRSEEYYMNLIADAMEPYLTASGISFGRNTPEMTALSSTRQANQKYYDLYLAIHSNAAGEGTAKQRGAEIYYYPGSETGLRAAIIFANNYRLIYPAPSDIKLVPSKTLIELNRTKAPAILFEVGYHDNPAEAQWIADNVSKIGRNLALSVADFIGVPFVEPENVRRGTVNVSSGYLNVRVAPDTSSAIVAKLPDGAVVSIIERVPGWYFIRSDGVIGFAAARYISLL